MDAESASHLHEVLCRTDLSASARLTYAIAATGGTSSDIRMAVGLDDRQILAAFDELTDSGVTLFRTGGDTTKERRAVRVNGKDVTHEEMSKAESVIGFWNDIMQSRLSLRAKGNLRMIIGRIRSYPEVDLTEHALIISSVCEDPHPWWTGKATLNIVYGNDAQFERTRERAQGNYNPNKLTPQQMMRAAGGGTRPHLELLQ